MTEAIRPYILASELRLILLDSPGKSQLSAVIHTSESTTKCGNKVKDKEWENFTSLMGAKRSCQVPTEVKLRVSEAMLL